MVHSTVATSPETLSGLIRKAAHHEGALIAVLQQQPGLFDRLINLRLRGLVSVVCGCFLALPCHFPSQLGHSFPERRSRTNGAHEIWVAQPCRQISFQRLPMLVAPHLVAVTDLLAHRRPDVPCTI